MGGPTIYEDTYDGHTGTVFIPCPTATAAYFGDYNRGAFVSELGDEENGTAVGAWADSREGCLNQNGSHDTYFQQVFSARFSHVQQ